MTGRPEHYWRAKGRLMTANNIRIPDVPKKEKHKANDGFEIDTDAPGWVYAEISTDSFT